MKKLWKNQKGFTLMEIIIVIVILGILAMIAIPRLIGFTSQAEIASDKEYAAVAARAAELYWAANDKTAPANIAALVTAEMLDAPGNGTNGALQYFTTVTLDSVSVDGVATVTLSGGANSGDITYNSQDGYTTAAVTP
ncbi:MAG: prepilin-type N-terminal cleavage/methylation domain-containing protein [Vallitaleaceae bacterium]|nr:prepilin-type N-terminal cleavage/methylation domain-containing protein [Vallitaleaceae bacterium]